MGVRQIRRCRSCGRKFTPRHQKTRVAESHQPKSPVRRVPTTADPSGASAASDEDEWRKLADEDPARSPPDEASDSELR
jgi:hypothetical protein